MEAATESTVALRQGWEKVQTAITAFFTEVGATEDAHTITLRLGPREIASPQDFADWLNPSGYRRDLGLLDDDRGPVR